MKIAFALAVTLCLGALPPAFASSAEPNSAPYRHHYRHHAVSHAPRTIAPSSRGRGDTDGLSRDPDDCNKGCIGGNPG